MNVLLIDFAGVFLNVGHDQVPDYFTRLFT